MKRTTPLKPSSKPMARGTLKRSAFKKKARKAKPWHDKGKLDACRGQRCYLAIPGVCRGETETVVPAHRNEGKGMGMKTPDEMTVPACFWCHAWYDQGPAPREEKRAAFDRAFASWKEKRTAILAA